MTLEWTKHPVDGDLAKDLRKVIRIYRREKGRGGHRFRFDDLRVLWGAKDRKGKYAILTHHEDRLWQFWYCDPEDGWKLQSWFKVLKDAQSEAEKPRPKPILTKPKPVPGKYIHATWNSGTRRGSKPIVVRCSSDYTREALTQVFQGLGCSVAESEVA